MDEPETESPDELEWHLKPATRGDYIQIAVMAVIGFAFFGWWVLALFGIGTLESMRR